MLVIANLCNVCLQDGHHSSDKVKLGHIVWTDLSREKQKLVKGKMLASCIVYLQINVHATVICALTRINLRMNYIINCLLYLHALGLCTDEGTIRLKSTKNLPVISNN